MLPLLQVQIDNFYKNTNAALTNIQVQILRSLQNTDEGLETRGAQIKGALDLPGARRIPTPP